MLTTYIMFSELPILHLFSLSILTLFWAHWKIYSGKIRFFKVIMAVEVLGVLTGGVQPLFAFPALSETLKRLIIIRAEGLVT